MNKGNETKTGENTPQARGDSVQRKLAEGNIKDGLCREDNRGAINDLFWLISNDPEAKIAWRMIESRRKHSLTR